MATTILLGLCCLVISIFIFTFSSLKNKKGLLLNWPILGTLPTLVANFNNLLDWGTLVCNRPGLTTFTIKGPWFTKLDLLITVDPANVQYISSTRFANFPRGAKSSEIFDVFGDGLFNSEGDEWAAHRKIHKSFFGQKKFSELSNKIVFEKVKDIMVVLDHVAGGGVVDLEDLFSRYTYDLTQRLVLGNDTTSLSLEWPQVPYTKAMNNAMQTTWMRYFLPEPIWKLQRYLGVGQEKVFIKAKHFLHKFSSKMVMAKHEEFNSRCSKIIQQEKFEDMLTKYLIEDDHYRSGEGDVVLNDTLLSLMLAGKDSISVALTWFFWNLSTNPTAKTKIRDEIVRVLSKEEREKPHVFTQEEVSKLVYLHAAVCESLRLHPPFPYQPREPCESDILPSGHVVSPNSTLIMIPLYVMARVEAIWGKDCADFKPERWIADDGKFKHEPSYKFFTFNSGPRICVGKDLAFTEIKTTVATIVHNYDVEVLKKQKVVPAYSSVLHTKNGLHARIIQRYDL